MCTSTRSEGVLQVLIKIRSGSALDLEVEGASSQVPSTSAANVVPASNMRVSNHEDEDAMCTSTLSVPVLLVLI